MIRFQCPACLAEQEIPIIGEFFRVGRKVVCMFCGAKLAVLVIALTQDNLMARLLKREKAGYER